MPLTSSTAVRWPRAFAALALVLGLELVALQGGHAADRTASMHPTAGAGTVATVRFKASARVTQPTTARAEGSWLSSFTK